MELTPRQRRALDSIVDTFCPPPNGDGLPSAAELGVTDTLLELIGANPREAERKQVAQLLGLWDTPFLTALGGGGFKRFSELPREQRESVLLSWCDSRVPQRRAAFQALRKGTLLTYWGKSGPGGERNRAWDAIDFPGTRGEKADASPPPLSPETVDADTTIDCDVCIVGSGAGGGTAAGVLAKAGLQVVVLEAGGYYDDRDFGGDEIEGLKSFYMGAPSATADQSVGLLAGACLGGGTVVNYSTSFRTPDAIREQWASHGVPAFTSDDYTQSLDAVVERIGVNLEHGTANSRDRMMEEGCRKLGWHVDAMPRNVRGCDQGPECGYCGLGCRLGAKQSVAKTWLVDAQDGGARLIVGVRAQKVIVEGGAARGVEALSGGGHRVTVRSRAVIAACGALHTPALLKRSGLQNPNVGRNLLLHPATPVWGIFDEELRPWEGAMQSRYSDAKADLGGGYGVKYETASTLPHIALSFFPWRGGRASLELMQALGHSLGMGVLLRDRDGGEVRVGRDGEPVPRYKLSAHDLANMRTGIDGAAEMLEAAGARRIFTSQSRWVSYDPGRSGSREQLMRDADACGYGAGRLMMGSFHIMGSARMGGSPATSACNPRGETWDVRDLYVCDASAFPTASGVNPMVSIESIAHMNARGIAAALA